MNLTRVTYQIVQHWSSTLREHLFVVNVFEHANVGHVPDDLADHEHLPRVVIGPNLLHHVRQHGLEFNARAKLLEQIAAELRQTLQPRGNAESFFFDLLFGRRD